MSATLAGILRQSEAVARLWQKRFNRAYNPNCARSPHYNCPVAVEKLPVALRAGEMIPPKH